MSGFKQSVVFAEQGMDIGTFPNTTGERASIEFTEPNDELTLIVNNTSNNGSASACSVIRTSGGAASNAFDRYIQTGIRSYAAGLNNNEQSYEIRGTTSEVASPQVGARLLFFESSLSRGNFPDINILRMGNTPNPGGHTDFNVLNLSGVAASDASTNLQVSVAGGGNAYHQYTGPADNWFHGVNKTANNNAWELQTAQVGLFPAATKIMIATVAGEVTFPLTPAFFAFLGATVNNVTGDGTAFTLGTTTALTEVYDQGGDFNTNGTFTAPVTGRYLLSAAVQIVDVGAAHTLGFIAIVTSNRTYRTIVGSPAAIRSSDNSLSLQINTVADMDAGDTATVQITVSNSTLTVDVAGAAAPMISYFTGNLQC